MKKEDKIPTLKDKIKEFLDVTTTKLTTSIKNDGSGRMSLETSLLSEHLEHLQELDRICNCRGRY